ncbi:MAG: T9SS type A sorting domain-containing protein [Saprospiraceae bacterium]|nr:T9SS type A sorting domain-containing protein [Candidatus Vicinibacter affinis]
MNNLPGEISKPYIFSLIKDMTHEYPNGANYPLSAPKIFWEFFKRSVAVHTENPATPSNEILAIPNPSNDFIEFSIPTYNQSYQWNLYDAYGRLRMKGNQTPDESFKCRKSDLGTGLYIFQADLGNRLLSKKIIFN